MGRRNYGQDPAPKHTSRDILTAFLTSARKSNFGNFRIEGDTLLYRAQSSVDAPRCHGKDNFDAWKVEVGQKIKETDGRLVDDSGKSVMLEALTADSKEAYNYKNRIQFFETNLVAQRVKGKDGKPVYLGNSSTLELVGRQVSYGNVRENRGQTDIQKSMITDPRFVMLPLTKLEALGVDVSTVEVIELTAPETVSVTEKSEYTDKAEVVQRRFCGACVFKAGARHFLVDLDRTQLAETIGRPFLAETPRAVQSVSDAYASLVPKEVSDARAKGLKVRQLGKWFFIPVDAPTLPTLSNDERLVILASNVSYGLDRMVLDYLTSQSTGARSKGIVEKLMEKVPRPLTLGHGTNMQSAIELGGVTYCQTSVEKSGYATLKLNQWYTPVKALNVEHKD